MEYFPMTTINHPHDVPLPQRKSSPVPIKGHFRVNIIFQAFHVVEAREKQIMDPLCMWETPVRDSVYVLCKFLYH